MKPPISTFIAVVFVLTIIDASAVEFAKQGPSAKDWAVVLLSGPGKGPVAGPVWPPAPYGCEIDGPGCWLPAVPAVPTAPTAGCEGLEIPNCCSGCQCLIAYCLPPGVGRVPRGDLTAPGGIWTAPGGISGDVPPG